MTDEVILAQALIFLVGGFDTSGSAITWAALELAHNKELQVINLIFSRNYHEKVITQFYPYFQDNSH